MEVVFQCLQYLAHGNQIRRPPLGLDVGEPGPADSSGIGYVLLLPATLITKESQRSADTAQKLTACAFVHTGTLACDTRSVKSTDLHLHTMLYCFQWQLCSLFRRMVLDYCVQCSTITVQDLIAVRRSHGNAIVRSFSSKSKDLRYYVIFNGNYA